MKLEKIILDGFKSFADKTEFNFDAPIIGIVGPNGCGKSNVVDAVKWVLGEQSVKSMRSGQMADVIFGGSSSRKPAGTAEVTLVISETTGQLPIETDQVQISRRIYKSGESEYRINNKVCRLKDIRELFMDTGIGVKAYSIIEQGQIEQLVKDSKSDRRDIFEEAAGISKYKAHKQEAMRKLERTEQNLLRLADIIGEVQKQLRSVKLQAGKARSYQQYTQRLKELQVNYSLVEYHKINASSTEKKSSLGQYEQQFASVAAEMAKADVLLSSTNTQITETEGELNRTDNLLVSIQSKIEKKLQEIDFLRERIAELDQRKQDAEQKAQKLREHEKTLDADLAKYRQEQINCDRSLEEKNNTVAELQKTIHDINTLNLSLEAELEDEKSGIIDIVRRTAQLHNELQSISDFRSSLSSQKDRLAGRANTVREEFENLLAEKAQYKARLNDIEKILCELQQSLESTHKKAEDIAGITAENNQKLANSKEIRSAFNSEISILADMESKCEGLNNAVKTILHDRNAENYSYVKELLADIITANVKYANAVEAALENKTDALAVSSTAELLADIKNLGKLAGRVNFICTDRIQPFADTADLSQLSGVCGRLVEFIQFRSEYAPLVWSLLGKTIVVDSINSAFDLSEKLPHGYGFVTIDGDLLNADGILKLGPMGKASGLISRKSQLNHLRESLAAISVEISALDELLEKNNQTAIHLDKLSKDLRTAVYEATTEQMQVNSKIAAIEQNVKRLSEEQPLIAGEIRLIEEQIAQSVQKEYDSKQKLQELDAVNKERTARIAEMETKYAEGKALQQDLVTRITDLKIELGRTIEQSKALQQTITSISDRIDSNRADLQAAQSQIQNCSEQSQQASRNILACESVISELFVEKETKQQNSSLLRGMLEKLTEQQKETETMLRQKRSEQGEIDHNINQLKVDIGQLEVRQQSLAERIKEELHLDLAGAYEDYKESQIDWDAVKEEIADLKGKIERLGNVNINSIAEQEELDKRNEFLSAQLEDLNNSKSQMQQLIIRLNKQSREKFRVTFEEIRANFQQIFRKLFGGGKADIIIEEAEDILEAGIDIIARPPGKETRSISLLSGGEKTMTAIALLFSVFKTKPSPFCMLDEVDAALDEANNERFNLLVREFQKDSQFIVITHSKRTMSIADALYGVTMQTRGVSKKISVRFDQFESAETLDDTAAVA